MNYAAITDWLAYIRDCVRVPDAHPELGGPTLNVDAGLSKVRAELEGTPYAARFSDAALQLMEQGTADEARQLLQTSLRGAPRVGPRVAALANRWTRGELDESVRTLLLRGLDADSTDPQLLAALAAFAQRGAEETNDALHLALPYNIDWVASHIGALGPAVDPDGAKLRFLALRALPADLPRFVAAIAAAGPDFVTRFTDALRGGQAPPHLVARLKPVLDAHPAFAGRVP